MAKRGKFETPRVETDMFGMPLPPRPKPVGWIVLAFVLVVLLVMILAGNHLKKGDTIYPNVRVAGVDVGGLTEAEARNRVKKTVEGSYLAETLEVILPDRTLVFDPVKANVMVDSEQAVREAMNFGRDGSALRALFQYLVSKKSIHTLGLDMALKVNEEYLKETIAQTAAETKIVPVHSTMSMDPQMTKLTVHVGKSGRELDEARLFDEVYRAYQRGDFDPLEWKYERIPYNQVDLIKLHERLAVPVKDARYDVETQKVIPSSNGVTFDLEWAQKKVREAEEGSTVEFLLEIKKPKLTTGKLNNQMFGHVLEYRYSMYVDDPDRTENLRLACEAVNGTIINPGGVFSFNEVVGERTTEKGYRVATRYGGSAENIDDVGSGVCQVASTIYYAALYMDLPTVMREPHMYAVDYVPAGCDAAIFWDSGVDYQFRNNRENPIKIQAYMDDEKVNIAFWGVEENENYVELSEPEVLKSWTDPDIEEADPSKPAGYREARQLGYPGSNVKVVKRVFDGSGKQLRKETLESSYKSRPNIFVVGTGAAEPAKTPEKPAEESASVIESVQVIMPE